MIEWSSLFWLALTIILFQVFSWIFHYFKRFPLLQPVALSIALLVVCLMIFKVEYKTYFEGSSLLHYLLGPSTVALAIPLYEKRAKLFSLWKPLAFSLFMGSLFGILSALAVGKLFGASLLILKSVAAKSVTTPIAIGITEKVGGDISLTAVMVIATGVFGAIAGLTFLRFFPFKDEEAQGFAMGMACHGIGTARCFQESVEFGTFAGLAIGLNGLTTALLLPFIFRLLGL